MDNNQQGYNPNVMSPYIGFGDAIKICFNKYTTFSGRATAIGHVGIIIFYLIALALLLPSLAVSWRRMHDIGKGGGWYFINLIPLVGNIIWIVWCCKESEPFDNRFGSK